MAEHWGCIIASKLDGRRKSASWRRCQTGGLHSLKRRGGAGRSRAPLVLRWGVDSPIGSEHSLRFTRLTPPLTVPQQSLGNLAPASCLYFALGEFKALRACMTRWETTAMNNLFFSVLRRIYSNPYQTVYAYTMVTCRQHGAGKTAAP